MTKYDQMIREIQLVNYKSLKRLDEVCKKHGLQYWAHYGTLIGTLRHNGFIPWDDDLDVGMMYEDFKKLCELPAEEWGDDCCFLWGESDDPMHDKLFGRVYQKNARIQSAGDVNNWRDPATGKAFSTSMMCDIFVFDYVPDDDAEYEAIYKKTLPIFAKKYKRSKLEFHAENAGFVGRMKGFLFRLWGKMKRSGGKRPWAEYHKYLRKLVDASNKGSRIGTYYTTDTFKYEAEDYFPLTTHKFEDMEIPIPKNYEKVLRDFYGDYMQLPPEDQRLHISFIYADLGDGRKYVVNPMKGSLGEGLEVNVEK